MRIGYLIEIGSILATYLIKVLFKNKAEDCYTIVRNMNSFTTEEPFFKLIKIFQSQFKAEKIILVDV